MGKTEETSKQLNIFSKIKLRPNADRASGYGHCLPDPNEKSDNGMPLPVPLRSLDCSNLDLSMYDNNAIIFDLKTIFPKDPDKMIKDFNPEEIIERHKNPGLGVRQLHKRGFTGKGLSVAIIDQLLAPHMEYIDNLVSYKEFGYDEKGEEFLGEYHGSAVASLLVGKTCGVAPEARLYYYAANMGATDKLNSLNYARALNDILDLNETLPVSEKIQAVSISWGGMDKVEGADEWNRAMVRAKKAGLYVISCLLPKDYEIDVFGLGRKNNSNPDDVNSYGRGYFRQGLSSKQLGIPMDNRTFADAQNFDGYVHSYLGGWSWVMPFYTGLFLIARQVDKNITLEEFHQKALDTAYKIDGAPIPIVHPEKLIDTLQNESRSKTQFIPAINKIRNLKGNGIE